MSLLGISLYPHLQSEAVMKQQLNLAVTLGYSQVYTTIQSPHAWDGPTQLKPPFQWADQRMPEAGADATRRYQPPDHGSGPR